MGCCWRMKTPQRRAITCSPKLATVYSRRIQARERQEWPSIRLPPVVRKTARIKISCWVPEIPCSKASALHPRTVEDQVYWRQVREEKTQRSMSLSASTWRMRVDRPVCRVLGASEANSGFLGRPRADWKPNMQARQARRPARNPIAFVWQVEDDEACRASRILLPMTWREDMTTTAEGLGMQRLSWFWTSGNTRNKMVATKRICFDEVKVSSFLVSRTISTLFFPARNPSNNYFPMCVQRGTGIY